MTNPIQTSGPFGLPMTDTQAFALEGRLKKLPRDLTLKRQALPRSLPHLAAEGRSDVSWISEESPDREGDVVRAAGMDDSHFRLNPIVTWNHVYDQPPVGRSLWRKVVRERGRAGVQAKTTYPPRPDTWCAGPWPADLAYDLLRAGLLNGKSIGFLPLKSRAPTAAERRADPALEQARAIIEEWLLVEYACCFLPMQPHAVVLPEEPGAGADPLARCLEPANLARLFEKSLLRVLASAEKSVNIY